ncbi:hypothetical protein ACPA5B_03680 [Pseudomonas solani]|uniref:hypothetical protein n=1 Tax=Pseudomonas solani TaxID=2731552 RepID=UPI003C2EC581
MSLRLMTLNLEIFGAEIHYFWNYKPEVKGVGGGLGWLYPEGSLHNLSYEALLELGSGSHEVMIDEKVRSLKSNDPQLSELENDLRLVRSALFFERNDCYVMGSPLFEIVMAFSAETAEKILPMLEEHHLSALAEYAQEIPAQITQEEAEKFQFFCSAGTYTKVPLKNLISIRKYFGVA